MDIWTYGHGYFVGNFFVLSNIRQLCECSLNSRQTVRFVVRISSNCHESRPWANELEDK